MTKRKQLATGTKDLKERPTGDGEERKACGIPTPTLLEFQTASASTSSTKQDNIASPSKSKYPSNFRCSSSR